MTVALVEGSGKEASGSSAAEIAAAVTGAAWERTIGSMLAQLTELARRLDRSDADHKQQSNTILEKLDEGTKMFTTILQTLSNHEVRLHDLEKKEESRRTDWRAAWGPIIQVLGWIGAALIGLYAGRGFKM